MPENQNLNYVTRVLDDVCSIAPEVWDGLLAQQDAPTPFMRHAYLSTLQTSESAAPQTGWTLQLISLWRNSPEGQILAAACGGFELTNDRQSLLLV